MHGPKPARNQQGRPHATFRPRRRVRAGPLCFGVMTDEPPADQRWRYKHHGSLGSTALVVLAEGMVRALKAAGVPLSPGNRADRALEIIRQSHDGRLKVTRDDPQTRALIAGAIRDTWEFYLIACSLPRERSADLDGKLKVMLQGSEKSNKPRDFQFEQLVGALFAMAEVPAQPLEPDLRFTFRGEDWGVAVKRVRSAGQLAPRTTKARKQLEQQHLRGLIAVNVDAFLGQVPASGDSAVVGRAFDKAVARLHRLLPELAEQRSLLGIMIIGAVAGWVFDGEKPRVFHPLIFQGRPLEDEERDRALVYALLKRLELGIGRRVPEIYAKVRAATEKR
jgi:hypothetical protein